MPSITNLHTGEQIQVSQPPVWRNGMWECGDQRFTDAGKTSYSGEVLAAAPTWDTAGPEYFWIYVGSFFDRFGPKGLAITSSEEPEVRGLVTLILPRQYVDLKRPDLPQLLGLLVAKGYITEEEVAAILTTPTVEDERYIKGLPQPID